MNTVVGPTSFPRSSGKNGLFMKKGKPARLALFVKENALSYRTSAKPFLVFMNQANPSWNTTAART